MDTSLKLYRAVTQAELDDLRAHGGRFRDSPHQSGEKGFFYELESAKNFARRAVALDGQQHFLVGAEVNQKVFSQGREHAAATEGKGVYLPVAVLDLLKTAVEVSFDE